MKAKPRVPHRSGCPISIALEILGDSWSLLIVRDMMFKGSRTFNAFLGSEECIASNVLADRLARLEGAGILTKEPDPADARRYIYRLTNKGLDLAPALVELVLWAARHEDTAAAAGIVREMQAHRQRFIADLRKRATSA